MFRRARTSCEIAAICAAISVLVSPAPASAFALKETAGGKPVHWGSPNVNLVVDDSLMDAVPAAETAVKSAAAAWSSAPTAPAFTVSATKGHSLPAVDGVNTVLFSKDFAPAKGALAVTLLSYDDDSGAIVDADVVVNASFPFSLLASTARALKSALLVSNEGGSAASFASSHLAAFDLQHVVTHELGHALGLGDVTVDSSAMMYAYTKPGDASVRAPSMDDIDGTSALYPTTAAASSSASGGCGATVAGAPLDRSDETVALASMLVAGTWIAVRRRARPGMPMAAVAIALLSTGTTPAQSAPSKPTSAGADATGHVVSVTTVSHDGVFESTVDVAPRACRVAPCPRRARAHVWGGTIAGVTQVVGERPAPRVDDEVDVALETFDADLTPASVTAVRPLSH